MSERYKLIKEQVCERCACEGVPVAKFENVFIGRHGKTWANAYLCGVCANTTGHTCDYVTPRMLCEAINWLYKELKK